MTKKSIAIEGETPETLASQDRVTLPQRAESKNARDISEAKNPDMRASFAAMQRAAKMARKIAIETNTGIVVVRDGKTVFISAEELRLEEE